MSKEKNNQIDSKKNFKLLLSQRHIIEALNHPENLLNTRDTILLISRVNGYKNIEKKFVKNYIDNQLYKVKNSIYLLSDIKNELLYKKENLEHNDSIILEIYRLEEKITNTKNRSIKIEQVFNKYVREYAIGVMSEKTFKIYFDKIEAKTEDYHKKSNIIRWFKQLFNKKKDNLPD